MPSIPPSSPNPPPASPSPPPRKRRFVLYGCGALLLLVVIVVATAAITIWWIQRPIKPVVLSAQEKAVVDDKLRRLDADRGPSLPANAQPGTISRPASPTGPKEPDRPYVPGAKVMRLTEREVNGLLNANTDLGKSARLEFGKDAINAYLAVPIPRDF